MGATAEGQKELLAVQDGYRESTQSWTELLVDLQRRGLTLAPKLTTGDGALGFWAALRQVYPETREQRCWVHKTANVLNKMLKSVQPRAKADLHQIWMAETRERPTRPSTPSWPNTRRSMQTRALVSARIVRSC
jgi:transposase-like protein